MSKLRRARPERLLRRHTELCEFAPKDASQAWNIGRKVESWPKMEGVEKRANLNRQQRGGGLATHSQSTTSKAGRLFYRDTRVGRAPQQAEEKRNSSICLGVCEYLFYPVQNRNYGGGQAGAEGGEEEKPTFSGGHPLC